MRAACFAPWLLLPVLASAASAESRAMVVHLPEAPIESMSRLAEGVTALAGYLQATVPDLTLEVKAFRKSEDALQFFATDAEGVALVVCDAAFLLDLPPGFEVAHRFVRGGRDSGRRMVVAKAGSGLSSLADLRGRSLTVTLSGSAAARSFLGESVFRGEIDPGQWFGTISRETDDFTAIAAVLYGRTEAALVAEDNPLVASHLGKELVSVYTSAPLPLSVIGVRPQALAAGQLSALTAALDAVASRAEAEPIRTVLSIDGFRSVEGGARRIADFLGGAAARRELEVALPESLPLPASAAAPVPPGTVPFLVQIELSEVPIPPELVESGIEGAAKPGKDGRKP